MKLDENFLAEDERKALERGDSIEAHILRGTRQRDAILKERYRGVKACPKRNFEPCIQDDCNFFINEQPGRPWWGYCVYRAMGDK